MILLISTCKEKLHKLEFVKPIQDIVKKDFKTIHYSKLTQKELEKSNKIIICGTSLKDNQFLKDIKKFSWIKSYNKPILGICAGSHLIGLIFGYKLKRKTEIGLKRINIKKEFLGIKGERQVYHLHNFQVLPELWKHKSKPIYATLFHPEVRNKELIVNFCRD